MATSQAFRYVFHLLAAMRVFIYLFICYRCHIMGQHLTFTCWNYFLVLSTIRGKESGSRTLGMIADKLQIQDTTDKKKQVILYRRQEHIHCFACPNLSESQLQKASDVHQPCFLQAKSGEIE